MLNSNERKRFDDESERKQTKTPNAEEALECRTPASESNSKALAPKRRRGRPPKDAVATALRKSEKEQNAIMREYRRRMLASPKSEKVLQKILDAALDDEHKGQTAAWKLVMDRLMPVSAFEKEGLGGSGRSAIQINITGVPGVNVGGSDDVLEGDYADADD